MSVTEDIEPHYSNYALYQPRLRIPAEWSMDNDGRRRRVYTLDWYLER